MAQLTLAFTQCDARCEHVYALHYLGVQIFLPIRTSVKVSPCFSTECGTHKHSELLTSSYVGAPTEVFIVSCVVNADWPVMPWVGERGER